MRAKDGIIHVIGEAEDENKLKAFTKGRKQIKGALAHAMYLQEQAECSPTQQRRFVEKDALHVLGEWFKSKGIAFDKDTIKTEKSIAKVTQRNQKVQILSVPTLTPSRFQPHLTQAPHRDSGKQHLN